MILPDVLQQFHCLDESSPQFPDQLTNLPHERVQRQHSKVPSVDTQPSLQILVMSIKGR